MSSNEKFQSLSLAGVAQRCAEESAHFFHRREHDPRYCFEMFRRAIVERDQRAWQLICEQYRPLVAGWVQRHRAFSQSGEEVQYFVNGAFAKMWSAFSPEKFNDFPNLKSLLRYLQLCVSSVITDHVRAAEYHEMLEDIPVDIDVDESTNVEREALARAQRGEFWQVVYDRLNDEKEKVVVYYSYVLGMKPSQLYQRNEEVFSNVREIYRVKENVLARLRRDEALKDVLQSYQ